MANSPSNTTYIQLLERYEQEAKGHGEGIRIDAEEIENTGACQARVVGVDSARNLCAL